MKRSYIPRALSGWSMTERAMSPDEWTKGVDIGVGLVWASLSSDPRLRTGDLDASNELPPWLTIHWGTVADEIATHRRHALAALALHGQPFGFTWGDVDWIRAAAGQLLDEFDRLRADHATGLNAIADRIAALLPPRESADG